MVLHIILFSSDNYYPLLCFISSLVQIERLMCDFFWQRSMDGGGDLVDIIRSAGSHRSEVAAGDTWQFPTDADEPFQNIPTDDLAASYAYAFDLWDPPLNELVGTSFSGCDPDMSYDGSCGGDGGVSIQKSKNIFSRVVQILPAEHSTLTHRMTRPFPMVTDHGVHTSSPRTPGIKRRKNPVKRVVCIPAPTAASSARPSSAEVVPSDLWAWRKYGQKPIKGSPYPRGYYRCSSSKGCLARKQVERSRSDPNMLVITYTSEHNHPWPTQRNSLAGSTRSSNPTKNHKITPAPKISNLKRDHINTTSSSILTTRVKEELIDSDHDIFDKLVLLESNHQCDDFFADLVETESDPYEGVDPYVNMFDWEHLS